MADPANGASAQDVGTAVVTVGEFRGKMIDLSSGTSATISGKRGILRGATINTDTTQAVTVDLGNSVTITIPSGTIAGTAMPFWDVSFSALKTSWSSGTGSITFVYKSF